MHVELRRKASDINISLFTTRQVNGAFNVPIPVIPSSWTSFQTARPVQILQTLRDTISETCKACHRTVEVAISNQLINSPRRIRPGRKEFRVFHIHFRR